MSINLRGVYLGCKHAVPQMIRQGKGAIVNTASIAGLRGFGGYGTYGAAKGGVVQLTRALAVEVARVGIRVNCVCPGIIETAMLDQGVAEMGLDRSMFVQLAGAAHPMAASAGRRRWRPPSCSWPRMMRRSSPASLFRWTVVFGQARRR
jgi:NAD(P)-dependent dehydrogenase (short-subunit alcohol dehydrogenase family)